MIGEKILVIGGTGFIGSTIMRYFNCMGTSSRINAKYLNFNILNIREIKALADRSDLNIIINCSGMTNVDECERNPVGAQELNGTAVLNLARACSISGKALVHISTDGIFDGRFPPYKESDKAFPVNVYGRSKLNGELAALQHNALVIRISTPFGYCSKYGKMPFNCFLLNNLSNGMKVRIAKDQITTPTFTEDIPSAIENLLQHKKTGIFHLGSSVPISRYDFALQFAESAGYDSSLVEPVNLGDLPLIARRPLNTSLDSTKIGELFNLTPLDKAIEIVAQQYKGKLGRKARSSTK